MRVILFRGKRIDNGEWVEGGYFLEPYTDKTFIVTWNSFGLGFIDYIEVVSETVGQYTGLQDRNGVRIFEGDVVAFDGGRFVVEYFESRMGFGFSGLKGRGVVSGFTMMDWEHLEVIGNIHDNSELLSVEGE